MRLSEYLKDKIKGGNTPKDRYIDKKGKPPLPYFLQKADVINHSPVWEPPANDSPYKG